MKKIICELCESSQFIKEDNFFVCQNCGCKYSVEDAKRMMKEVPDDVPNKISVKVVKVGHVTQSTVLEMSSSAPSGKNIASVFVEGPDQNGYIGTQFSLENISGKTIKSVTVYLIPFDADGNQVSCTIEGYSVHSAEIAEIIPVGGNWEGYAEGMWHNHSIAKVKIDHVHCVYIDGTEQIFEGKEFDSAPNVTVAPKKDKTDVKPKVQKDPVAKKISTSKYTKIEIATMVCFSLWAIFNITISITLDSVSYFEGMMYIVGSILVVTALLKKKPIISAVGFALLALAPVPFMVRMYNALKLEFVSDEIFDVIKLELLYCIVCLFFMLASLLPKCAKIFCIIACIIACARCEDICINNFWVEGSVNLPIVLCGSLFAASALLIGLVYKKQHMK